jgi:uncharacterized protein
LTPNVESHRLAPSDEGEEMANANEDIVKAGYDAFGQGDMDALKGMMSADIVHNAPGNNQIAGEYKGVDDVLGYYAKMFDLTGGNMSTDMKSATAQGDDHVIAVHRFKGGRDDKTVDLDETLDFTIKDGKIVRIDESNDDQALLDDFWG